MELYVVQPGDTIFTIAEKFNVPYERLLIDNNITPNFNIVSGQIIIISKPELTYQVQYGDTLQSIADSYGITTLQLIQNNPYLLDRDYLNVGETLIIRFDNNEKQVEVNAFAFSHIRMEDLQKALPFMTYITINGYRLTAQGNIIEPRDDSILEAAKEYGVAPIMLLSTFNEQGRGSFGITNKVLNDEEAQIRLLDNIMQILREKQLYGINFGFQYIIPEDLQNYNNLIASAKEMLSKEGYQLWVTLLPKTFGYDEIKGSTNPYISQIGQIADCVILLSYQWTVGYFPTVGRTTFPFLRDYTEYVMALIPPEKIFIGYTRIAYDFELPYVEGESNVTALANSDALRLASQIGTELGFDEYSMTPYYYYDNNGIRHFVWFKDARTINAILDIIVEFNLRGISIWNIMDYTPQLWVTVNSQYKIEKVSDATFDITSDITSIL